MEEERRKDNKDLMFMMGEVHAQCKRIPIIEAKMEKQDKKIDTCSSKSRVAQVSAAFGGGMLGGFIAVIAKKLTIG